VSVVLRKSQLKCIPLKAYHDRVKEVTFNSIW